MIKALIKKLEEETEKIKERNRRVETDKAWETSTTRKIIIVIATYFVISLFLFVAKIERPFINALIPTFAFILSTLSLSFFKKLWLRYIYKRKEFFHDRTALYE
jgi:preprotein translocase subunit SecF